MEYLPHNTLQATEEQDIAETAPPQTETTAEATDMTTAATVETEKETAHTVTTAATAETERHVERDTAEAAHERRLARHQAATAQDILPHTLSPTETTFRED